MKTEALENKITTISDEELASINQAILTRYGLDFTGYETVSLKRRIARIVHKFELGSTFGLWQKLLYDKEFILKFKDEISVGLTEMFRNPELWVKLRDEILPGFARNGDVNIWHAGCSTGEEVYSMAITVHECGLTHRVKALATDLSDKFIEHSAKGEYDLELLERYASNYHVFHPHKKFPSFYTVKDEKGTFLPLLKSYAQYKQHNLTIDAGPGMYDIIFCRNVMIYFNESLKMKVLKLFHNCLKKNGILIIGYFDAMPSQYNSMYEYFDSGLKIFRKI